MKKKVYPRKNNGSNDVRKQNKFIREMELNSIHYSLINHQQIDCVCKIMMN